MFYFIQVPMDKRIRKTISAIYVAFAETLKEKDYAEVTIEDILKRAKVSRSTFYAHFKTKSDVLDSVSRNIFHHVFSHTLQQEESHDFSNASVLDYKHLFVHVLYHLRDESELIQSILSRSCKIEFLNTLREYMSPLIQRCLRDEFFARKDIPEELHLRHIEESFLASVAYWFESGCQKSPEEMIEAFVCLNQ